MKFARKGIVGIVGALLISAALFRNGYVSQADSESPSTVVPIISATKSVAVVVGNADADADPGETLEYTVTINNTGADPGTSVELNDTIQNITAFVPGSMIASPIAVNDAYGSIGNVGINVTDGASDLLANDLNPNGAGGLTIVAPIPTTSTHGGAVAINAATGAFTYTPAVGFEGADSFTYTVGNGTGLTNTATVSITVSGMIWFVQNGATACTAIAAGCGRLSTPFSTLAAFNTVNVGGGSNPDNNDSIFLYENAVAYTGAVALRTGQKLIGQDATAPLAAVIGITLPTFSNALPTMNSANATITNTTSTVTLNTNATLRGFSVNSTTSTGVTDPAGAITGVTVSEVTVSTSSGAAVLFSNTAGTLSFRSISSNGAANGISLTNTTGSFTVTGDGGASNNGSGGVIQNTTGHGVVLVNTVNVSLGYLNIINSGGAGVFDGINGSGGLNGFSLIRSTISDSAGDTGNADGVSLGGAMNGTYNITNTVIGPNRHDNLQVRPTSGTINAFNITGGTISGSVGNSGINFNISQPVPAQPTVVTSFSMNGTALSNNFADGIQFDTGDNSTATLATIQNCSFTGNNIGMDLDTASTADVTFKILNNNLQNHFSHAMNVFGAGTGSTLNATIDGNTIGSQAVLDSGSAIGNGMRLNVNEQSSAKILVNNNTIRQVPNARVIEAIARLGTGGASFVITNNQLFAATGTTQDICGPIDTACPGAGIYVAADLGNTACARVSGNTVNFNPLATPGGLGSEHSIRVRQVAGPPPGIFSLEGGFAALAASNTVITTGQTGTINNVVVNSCSSPPPLAAGSEFLINKTFTPTVESDELNLSRIDAYDLTDFYEIRADSNFAKTSGCVVAERAVSIGMSPIKVSFDASAIASGQSKKDMKLGGNAIPVNRAVLFDGILALFIKLGSIISPSVSAQKTNANEAIPESGETVTHSVGTLPPGESVTVRFRATVDNGPYASGVNAVINTASVSGNFTTLTTNTTSIPLDAAPDLAVTKSEGGGITQPGGTVTYTLTYVNNTATSGQHAANVVLTETVPPNTTFNAASSAAGWGGPGCVNGAAAGTVCTLLVAGTVNAGDPAVNVNFAVNVLAALPAGAVQISNISSIAEGPNVNGSDRVPANNTGTDATNIIGNWDGSASTAWNTPANWSNDQVPPSGNNVSIPNVSNQPVVTVSDITLNNMVMIGENVTIGDGRTVTVTGLVALGANVVDGQGILALTPTAAIIRTSGQVNSTLEKSFASTGAFLYPVGTVGQYSPVNVNVTAGSGPLSVQANTGTVPATPVQNPLTTLQRYWSLNGTGITVDLTFNYLQSDVAGNELNYRPLRVSGSSALSIPNVAPCPGSGRFCVDPAANTIFLGEVSTFSDWSASELAPTAAGVTVAGRVRTDQNRSISRAFVTITDPTTGLHYQTVTNTFGRFQFGDVPAGHSYILTVMHRRYQFENATQLINVMDSVSNVEFVGIVP